MELHLDQPHVATGPERAEADERRRQRGFSMSSPEPREDLRLECHTASRGLGYLGLLGIAAVSLIVSAAGIFVWSPPLAWLWRLLGGDVRAFIAAFLVNYAVIYGLVRSLHR